MTDIVGQGIVRDRRARLKLPSSQDAVSVLVLVFCGVLVLYPMVYLVVLSVNVGDPQTFPPDEYGIEHYRDLIESWRVSGLLFKGSRPAPLLSSVQRTGRCFVRELAYGVRNAAPHRGAIEIILRRKVIGARGAFFEGLLAVPLQHQVGGAPDVDVGYHTGKIARLRSLNL